MDAVESVRCIGWPGAACTDSEEHNNRPKKFGVSTGRDVPEGGASSARMPPLLAPRTKFSMCSPIGNLPKLINLNLEPTLTVLSVDFVSMSTGDDSLGYYIALALP